jgi:hypothetical protein
MRIAQLSRPLGYGQPHFLNTLIKAKNEAQVEEILSCLAAQLLA